MNARHRTPDNPPPPTHAEAQRELTRRRYRFARRWLTVLAGTDIGTGVAYLAGPTTAPNLQLVAQAVPIALCAILFAAVGVCLAAGLKWGGRWYIVGGFTGAVLWLVWGGALTITVMQQTATSAVGLPLYGGLAAMHMLIVYGAWMRFIGTVW